MIGFGFSLSPSQSPVTGEGGGGEPTPPEGMAFLYAENGDPITDKDGNQVYALEAA